MSAKKPKAKELTEPEKAGEAVLLLSDRLKDSRGYGKVLLEKALFYADQKAYLKTGKTITGLTYVRQHFGPTVAPREFLPLVDSLEKAGKVRWETVKKHRRLIPLVSISEAIQNLSENDRRFLTETAEKLFHETAGSVSKASHGLAWQIAADQEEIPPFTVFVSEAPIRESDVTWARQQIERR